MESGKGLSQGGGFQVKPRIKIVYHPRRAPYVWAWVINHGKDKVYGLGIPNHFETIGEAIRKAMIYMDQKGAKWRS